METQTLSSRLTWTCPGCTYMSDFSLQKCEMCETPRTPSHSLGSEQEPIIMCDVCETIMPIDTQVCTCGYDFRSVVPAAEYPAPPVFPNPKTVETTQRLGGNNPQSITKNSNQKKQKFESPQKQETVVVMDSKQQQQKGVVKKHTTVKEFDQEYQFPDLFWDVQKLPEKPPVEEPVYQENLGFLFAEQTTDNQHLGNIKKPKKEQFVQHRSTRPEPGYEEELGLVSIFGEIQSTGPVSNYTNPKKRTDFVPIATQLRTPMTKSRNPIDEEFIICHSCKEVNPITVIECRNCKIDLYQPPATHATETATITTDKKKEEDALCDCPSCTMPNHSSNNICLYCASPMRSVEEDSQLAPCPDCKFQNYIFNPVCVSCDKPLPELHVWGMKKLFDACHICNSILDMALFDDHVKACQETNRKAEEMRLNAEIDYLEESCLYCKEKYIKLAFDNHLRECERKNQYFKNEDIFGRLTPLQTSAIQFMHENSHKQHFAAKPHLMIRIQKLGYKEVDLEALYSYICQNVPVIIHVHVSKHMEFFVKDDFYRSQFETNKSSGTLNRNTRIGWESRMFFKAYDKATDFERVKYGTINLTNDPKGVQACRSYGNSYLLLKSHVRERCTFTDQDSSNTACLIGTFKFCYHLLNKLNDNELKATIQAARGDKVCSRVIGSYKEIQIHGPVNFREDVEKLYVNESEVKDPKFMNMVEEFSKKFSVPFEIFHP